MKITQEKSIASEYRKKRVFLDIDSLTQWGLGVHQRFPRAQKVAIEGLEPGSKGKWDAVGTYYPNVIREGGLFRMWYSSHREAEGLHELADRHLVSYAESEDGIHWRKPDLKITGQNRYPGNNLLTLPGVPMSVIHTLPGSESKYLACTLVYAEPQERDVTDVPGNPDPMKEGGSGTHIWSSDNGFHWKHVTRVVTHGDWTCLYADLEGNRYLLYNKICLIHGMTTRRSAIGLESKDGIQWEGYAGPRKWREMFTPDDYDDFIAQQHGFLHGELYTVGIYRAGEIFVSLESMLDVGPPLRPIFGQNAYGQGYLRLGFSHDGMHWRHPKGRPPLLEYGEPGSGDAGFACTTCTFIEDGDDLYFYYLGEKYHHGWSINPNFTLRSDIDRADERGSGRIMMAKIRRDRFASLASTYRGSFDVDADFRMDERLLVNVLANDGQVRVALAEKENHYHGSLRKHEHLPGFSFEDCVPITGDHLNAPVLFKNARIADIPADLPLTLRFELNRAEIFAYEWKA